MTITCLLLWLPSFIYLDLSKNISIPEQLNFQQSISIPTYGALIGTLLLAICNGLFLSTFIYRLSREWGKSIFPMILYLLSVGVLPRLHTHFESQIALLLCLLSLYIFYELAKKRIPVEETFLITLTICSASFFVPEFIITLPIFIILIVMLRLFSLRVLLAYIIGIATFVTLMGTYFYFSNTWQDFSSNLLHSLSTLDLRNLRIHTYGSQEIYNIALLAIGLTSIIMYMFNFFRCNIKIRTTFSGCMLLFVICIVLMFFKGDIFNDLTCVWLAMISFFSTYIFMTKQTWFRFILFGLFIAIHILCFILSINHTHFYI